MTHFTVFGGVYVHEIRGFSPPRRRPALGMWGFILGSLLAAVTTVASVTVTVAQAALH
jgi:hypothetical protein